MLPINLVIVVAVVRLTVAAFLPVRRVDACQRADSLLVVLCRDVLGYDDDADDNQGNEAGEEKKRKYERDPLPWQSVTLHIADPVRSFVQTILAT